MTIREKLADWISGGALSKERDSAWRYMSQCIHQKLYLVDISNATASGKSGTAKKIHRMATEALTDTKS